MASDRQVIHGVDAEQLTETIETVSERPSDRTRIQKRVVGETFDLEDAADAQAYLEERQSVGKVVLEP